MTPLQLAAAASAVANDGTLLQAPHGGGGEPGRGAGAKVSRSRRSSGRPSRPRRRASSPPLLEGVVIRRHGQDAAVAGYRVAGKTGTAQIPVPGGYLRNGYLPSFVGFAPADRPILVGVVAIAEPQGFEYHGGQVAAPVFGAIARQVLLYRGVHPERGAPLVSGRARW